MKLWKEYAIEPTLFSNYNLASEILGGIGIDRGRIVGAVPKKWDSRVRDAVVAKNRPVDQLRLVERLRAIKDAIIPREYPYNGERLWIDQVLECHAQRAFDGILADGRHASPEVAGRNAGSSGRSLLGVRAPFGGHSHCNEPRSRPRLYTRQSEGRHCGRRVLQSFHRSSKEQMACPIEAIATKLREMANSLASRSTRLAPDVTPLAGRIIQPTLPRQSAGRLPKGISIDAMLWKERPGGPTTSD